MASEDQRGTRVMKKYTIDSISKYLAIIEESDISQYVYRGQNEPYFSIKASGFRPYWGGWNSDKIFDMEHLQVAFKDRIISQLTEDEKRFFLAFCQHHGIPTNLVDVSYSPLVALFFACDGKSEMKFSLRELIGNKTMDELEKDNLLQDCLIHNLINQAKKPFSSPFAQLYMIKKERLINITDIVIEMNGKNLFEELLENEELVLKLTNKLEQHFDTLDIITVKEWTKNILVTYVDICEVSGFAWSERLYRFVKALIGDKESLIDIDYQKILQAIEVLNFNSESAEEIAFDEIKSVKLAVDKALIASIYMSMLMEILVTLKSFPRKVNIDLDIYFTYQPPELFGRIANQQSFFIYQSYLFTNEGTYDYCELNVQSVNPDIVIEIDEYSDILYELNLLGINNGTIYGDIDNIAKAILKTSGRLLKV